MQGTAGYRHLPAAAGVREIGIGLGTSSSAAAALRGGRPAIIPGAKDFSPGSRAFSGYVAITADGLNLIGEPARRQAVANPEGTAAGFRRKMGLCEKVRQHDRELTPEQLSSLLLQKVRRDASRGAIARDSCDCLSAVTLRIPVV